MSECKINREELKKEIETLVVSEMESTGYFQDGYFSHPDLSKYNKDQKGYLNTLVISDKESDKYFKDLFLENWKEHSILGKYPVYNKIISDINSKYNTDIIKYDNQNRVSIEVTDDLIDEYEFASDDGLAKMLEKHRQTYVDTMGEEATDIITIDNYFDHPSVNDPSIQSILKLAFKINPDFKVGITDNLDDNAVSVISKGLILLKRNRLDEVSEELSHFIIEVLPEDNKDKIEFLKEVLNHKIYQETLEKYKNNPLYKKADSTIDYDKIKREAAAKLLAQFVNESVADTAQSKYKSRYPVLQKIINSILNFIKGFIGKEDYRDKRTKEVANSLIELSKFAGLDFTKYDRLNDIFFSANPTLYHEYNKRIKGMFEVVQELSKDSQSLFAANITNPKVKADFERLMKYTGLDKHIFTKSLSQVSNMLRNVEVEEGITLAETLAKNADISSAIEQLALVIQTIENFPIQADNFAEGLKKLLSSNNLTSNGKTALQNFEETGELDYLGKKYTAQDLLDMTTVFDYIRKNFETYIEETASKLIKIGDFTILDKETGKEKEFDPAKLFTDRMNSSMGRLNSLKTAFENIAEKAVTRFFWEILSQKDKVAIDKAKDIQKTGTNIDKSVGKVKYKGVYKTYDELKLAIEGKGDNKDSSRMDKVMGYVSTGLNYNDSIIRVITTELLAARVQAEFNASETSLELQEAVISIGLTENEKIEFGRSFLKDISFTTNDGSRTYEKRNFISPYRFFEFKEEEKVYKKNILNAKTQDERELAQIELENFYKEHGGSLYKKEYYIAKQRIREISKILKEHLDPTKYELVKSINNLYEESYLLSHVNSYEEMFENKEKLSELIKKLIGVEEAKIPMSEEDKDLLKEQLTILDDLYKSNEDASAIMFDKAKETYINKWINGIGELRANDNPRNILDNIFTILKQTIQPTKEYKKIQAKNFEKAKEFDKFLDTDLVKFSNEAFLFFTKYDKLLKVNNGELVSFTLLSDNEMLKKHIKLKKNSIEARYLMGLQRTLVASIDRIQKDTEFEDEQKIQMINQVKLVYVMDIRRMLENEVTYQKDLKINDPNYQPDITSGILPVIFKDKPDFQKIFNTIIESDLNINSVLVPGSFDIKSEEKTIEVNESGIPVDLPIEQRVALGNLSISIKAGLKEMNNSIYIEPYNFIQNDYAQEILNNIFRVIDLLKNNNADNPDYKFIFDLSFLEQELNEGLNNKADMSNFLSIEKFERILGTDIVQTIINIASSEEIDLFNETAEDPLNPGQLKTIKTIFQNIQKTHILKNEDVLPGEVSDVKIYKIPKIFTRSLPLEEKYTEKQYSKELRITNINPKFTIEKQDRVNYAEAYRTGKSPNVNMNGEFLPIGSTKFIDNDYIEMQKNDKKFRYYKAITKAYWEEQEKNSYHSKNLDTLMPSVSQDHYEQWVHLPEKLKVDFDNFMSIFKKSDANQLTNTADTENVDIVDGEVVETKNDPLDKVGIVFQTKRPIPIEAQTRDPFGAVLFYISDSQDVEAKRKLLPTVLTIRDTLQRNQAFGGNKNRVSQLDSLINYEFYGRIGQDTLTTSPVGKAINTALRLAANNLLFDVLGGTIEGVGGFIQNFMRKTDTSRPGEALFLTGKALKEASIFRFNLTKDMISVKNAKKSKYYLMTKLFGMLPNELSNADQSYLRKQFSSIIEMGMKFRSYPSEINDLDVQLAILLKTKVIVSENKKYSVNEIYETNKDTGKLQLIKDVADNKELFDKWNPQNGTEVKRMVPILAQEKANILGNNSKYLKPFAKYDLLGNVVVFMKSWLYSPLLKNRFGKLTTSDIDGSMSEGKHLTFFRIFYDYLVRIRKEDPSISLGSYLKYIGTSKNTEFERNQIVRMVKEIGLIFLTYWMISLMGFDDDDEDRFKKLKNMDYLQQLAILFAMRMNQETSVYSPFPIHKAFGASEIGNTFTDPTRVIRTTWDKLSNITTVSAKTMGYWLGGSDKGVFYKRDGGFGYSEKGDMKIVSAFMKFFGLEAIPRTMNPERGIKIIDKLK